MIRDPGNIHGAVLPKELCPDVVFATPSLEHKVAKKYNRSMLQTYWLLFREGLTPGHMDRDGDCFVAKVRNKMVTDFLRQFPTTENFFFIDDDVGWPPEKVLEFINRPEPVVCGVYPKKSEELDFPTTLAVKDGQLVEQDGLYLAILAPTGFMRIKRSVLETMCGEAPRFRDTEPDGSLADYASVFEAGPGPDGLWWGEDYTFCRKWQALGGEIWIDPTIGFSHQGLNNWYGCLGDNLWLLKEKAAATLHQEETLSDRKDKALRDNVEQLMRESVG